MSKADQWVNVILIAAIIVYLSVLISVFVSGKGLFLTTLLNLLSASAVLVYWIQKRLSIQQHYIDLPEILILCFEIFVAGFAVYSLVTNQGYSRLKAMHYIFFGVHLASLVVFLLFMLTFKMDRLF